MPVTVRDIARFKAEGKRFAVLTAYDFPTASILDEAGIPVLLVGDSLAQVVLGHPTTLPASMAEMLHHTRAVARAARNALVVADMPFGSYQISIEDGVRNAVAFLKDGGAHAVKIEGPRKDLAAALVASGIPVMGHLGLVPQSIHAMGGYRVQARSEEESAALLEDAQHLQEAGAFSLVLEGIPAKVAAAVTESLLIPTIGIGAGPSCDAQVLVIHDLLGLSPPPYPRFVKPYDDLRSAIAKAAKTFQREVEEGVFPGAEQTYA